MIITRNSPATPEALRETMSTTQSMCLAGIPCMVMRGV
jgi:hypothetical protein